MRTDKRNGEIKAEKEKWALKFRIPFFKMKVQAYKMQREEIHSYTPVQSYLTTTPVKKFFLKNTLKRFISRIWLLCFSSLL